MLNANQVAALQGGYYVASGVWPLLHMRSFVAVTGPKSDLWLVRTVGLLVSCVGLHLLDAARRGRAREEARLLAGTSSAALAGVDTWYPSRRVISPVYLLDAVPEAAFALYWATCRPR